ncbi:MAG: AsmA family protein [Magnetococcus sp. DMHC-1]|nr:AsmA family protein [Magnetococcales bacterium]
MGGKVKKLLIFFLVSGVMVGGVALWADRAISPGQIKSRISAWVEKNTGRQLMIQGDIALTFYPWIGFKVANATLANDPLFGPEPMVEMEEIVVKVKLLPLLQRHLEVDRIAIQGVYFNLARDRAGRGNWSGMQEIFTSNMPVAPGTTTTTTTTTGLPPQNGATLLALSSLTINGIKISSGAMRFQDEATGNSLALEEFNLESGPLRAGQPVNGYLDTSWSLAHPELAGSLGITGQVFWNDTRKTLEIKNSRLNLMVSGNDLPTVETIQATLHTEILADLKQKTIQTDKTDLYVDAQGGEAPAAGANLKLSGDLNVNWVAETLHMTGLRMTLLDHLQIQGTLEGQKILHAPSFTSVLTLVEFSPQTLLKRLDRTTLAFRDAKVMQVAELKTTLQLGLDHLALSEIKGRLDATHLTGTLRIDHFQKPAVRFDLQLDQMDADRYQAGHSPMSATQAVPASATRNASVASAAVPDPTTRMQGKIDLEHDEDIMDDPGDDLDPDEEQYETMPGNGLVQTDTPGPTLLDRMIRGDWQGKVQAEQFKIRSVTVTKADLTVRTGQGLVKVEPLRGNLYGGSLETNLQFDMQGQEPLLQVNRAQWKGIDLTQLPRDGDMPHPISGRVDGQTRFETRLGAADTWRKTLNGTLQLAVHDGALEGVDLEHRILTTYATLKSRPVTALQADRGKTPFSELTATATIRQGVVDNPDLKAVSGLLTMQGAGQFDLVRQQMDYGIKAQFLPALEGIDHTVTDLRGLDVPVRFTGAWRQPTIQVELAKLLESAMRTKAVEKIGNKLEEKLRDPKVQEKLNKLEKKFGSSLNKLLPF